MRNLVNPNAVPSLTYGVAFGRPKTRCWLVSLSVKRSGTAPCAYKIYSPKSGWWIETAVKMVYATLWIRQE
jgi:hypothetical protein